MSRVPLKASEDKGRGEQKEAQETERKGEAEIVKIDLKASRQRRRRRQIHLNQTRQRGPVTHTVAAKMTFLIAAVPAAAFQLFSVITLFQSVWRFFPLQSQVKHNSTLVTNSLCRKKYNTKAESRAAFVHSDSASIRAAVHLPVSRYRPLYIRKHRSQIPLKRNSLPASAQIPLEPLREIRFLV